MTTPILVNENTSEPKIALAKSIAAMISNCLEEGKGTKYQELLDVFDRVVLSEALRQTEGNQTAASRKLGLNRGTLRTRFAKLAINPSVYRPEFGAIAGDGHP